MKLVTTTQESPCNRWVEIECGGDLQATIVSLYTSILAASRTDLWISLATLSRPLIVVGDFNMVEDIMDRWQ